MIESICVCSEASFGSTPEVMDELSSFNFIFGANGSGKTTISRVLADSGALGKCSIKWKGGTALQVLAYNRDFVTKHYHQVSELPGIFTLGEKDAQLIKNIADAKSDLDKLKDKLESLNETLQGTDGTGGKKEELATLEEVCKSSCWAQKQTHDAKLKGAFEGYRNSAEKFREKLFQERTANTATSLSLDELERKAATIFGDTPSVASPIALINTDELLALETKPILAKRVIGKADIDIARMIQKLGNSDWVRNGRAFYEVNDGVCPFCQQSAPESLARSLNEYFDEAFETDSREIASVDASYRAEATRVQQNMDTALASGHPFLDSQALKAEKDLFDAQFALNLQRLGTKRSHPSQAIVLDSLLPVLTKANALIEQANAQGASHNATVANLASERSTLTSQVWRYLIDVELKAALELYDSRKSSIGKAIEALERQVVEKQSAIAMKQAEIELLEKDTTSIQPTIDAINRLLRSFGFCGFSLAKAENQRCYKLVRPDGTDAKETLSEGERTFITFLYFYHLLKGSDSESGMTVDRIVVFDDPVSSLDSDILFIVGSLIKGLFDEVRSNTGYIKQIFVMTHNVYFHKEVTFNPKRVNDAMNEESFWTIRKSGLESRVQRHPSNPIKTSYELLWAEVRNPKRANLTIQNTLRRILENYFRILGNVDPDAICGQFEGKDRLICKSLFSWINDGSHFAHDDLYVSIDDSMVEKYLAVFAEIFKRTGHLEHYKMMMGNTYSEVPLASPAA